MKKNHGPYKKILLLLIVSLFCFNEANAIVKKPPLTGTLQDSQQAVKSSDDAILSGSRLFEGSMKFENGGASCISCHNVNNDLITSGGLLAKDLTNVYARLGDAGLSGIIGAPPFPAMASAYSSNRLTEEEIADIKAFLQFVDSNSGEQQMASNNEIFLAYGPVGLIVWLIMVYLFWTNRKKESVKKEIFDRQIKPIN
ncbi:MAG: cytochrome c [Cytophagales bacterium]|nr:cytochrome c [Cytophagales bacterium]